jgi:hypothetical protein
MARNAVVDSVLGYVKRHGWCDFLTDGSFDAGTETQLPLNEDTEPPANVPRYYTKVVAGDLVEMSPAEKAIVDAGKLADFKLEKALQFDQHTTEILAAGIEYPPASGNFYGITPSDLLAVQAQRDVGIYPFLVVAIGYTGAIVVNDTAEANNLLVAARAKLRDVTQAGADLLELIRAAPDKATLDAITDPR